jgi:3-phenylpropionate/trans-cinnamate dioxygenase ferredoxin component
VAPDPSHPAAALSAGSVVPPRDPSLEFGALDRAAAAVLDLLERHASTHASVRDALLGLAALCAAARPDAPAPAEDLAAERAALAAGSPHGLSADELENFAIYDRYFGVVRVPPEARSFAAAMLEAWSLAFADLSEALLARDELAALLRAMRAMLARCGSVETDATPAREALDAPKIPSDDAARIFLRWKTGHHVFALCAMQLRDAFAAARAAAASRDAAAIVAGLERAGACTRALAAAMWYASEFPIAFYEDLVRPTMVAAGAHGGFSGTQNADYERARWERERCIEDLFAAFGEDASAWPPAVYAALALLGELETQLAEHHVLVAASKVRLDPSLAQMALGPGAGSAVAALREKAEAAATDIPERFSSRATRRVRVCAVADVPAERPLAVKAGDKTLVVCRAYGAMWACDGICTHAGGPLGDGHMAGDAIVCPDHGAKFDPRTGAVLREPAKEPLGTYVVVIDGTDVFVELP